MKFKVGDRVSFGGIRGTVKEVNSLVNYPVTVRFDNGMNQDFTLDGRFLVEHTKPLLKKLKSKSQKFKAGDKVIIEGILEDGASYPYPLKVVGPGGQILFTVTEHGRYYEDGPITIKKMS